MPPYIGSTESSPLDCQGSPTLTSKIHALETLTVIIRALSYLSSVNLVIHHSLFQMVKKIFQLILPYIFSQEFADSLGIPFLETSAKNATNVEQSFMTMAAEIKKRMGPGATAGGAEKSNVKIQSTPVKQSGGGCC